MFPILRPIPPRHRSLRIPAGRPPSRAIRSEAIGSGARARTRGAGHARRRRSPPQRASIRRAPGGAPVAAATFSVTTQRHTVYVAGPRARIAHVRSARQRAHRPHARRRRSRAQPPSRPGLARRRQVAPARRPRTRGASPASPLVDRERSPGRPRFDAPESQRRSAAVAAQPRTHRHGRSEPRDGRHATDPALRVSSPLRRGGLHRSRRASGRGAARCNRTQQALRNRGQVVDVSAQS